MTRRFLTAEDVRRSRGGAIVVDAATVVTPQALEQARQSGIEIRIESGAAWSEPAPDRGPDAAEALHDLPHMPEPQDEFTGGGVIVTAVGRNRPGVLAELTGTIARSGAGIRDVSQKMVDQYFHLLLVVELGGADFVKLKAELQCLGGEDDYVVRVMHDRVFRFMHRV